MTKLDVARSLTKSSVGAHRRAPSLASLWRSPVVVWIGRAALLAATAFTLFVLVRDVTTIL